MITTKIQIAPHLAQYCLAKWGNFEGPVCFPPVTELYSLIYDLTIKRPLNVQIDSGNLEIVLPNRQQTDGEYIRKNPEVYNYLSEKAVHIIEKRIRTLMRAELHDLMDDNKHRYGVEYIESAHTFRCKYQMEAISDDALLKDYQRWKENIRQRNKRGYKKKHENFV